MRSAFRFVAASLLVFATSASAAEFRAQQDSLLMVRDFGPPEIASLPPAPVDPSIAGRWDLRIDLPGSETLRRRLDFAPMPRCDFSRGSSIAVVMQEPGKLKPRFEWGNQGAGKLSFSFVVRTSTGGSQSFVVFAEADGPDRYVGSAKAELAGPGRGTVDLPVEIHRRSATGLAVFDSVRIENGKTFRDSKRKYWVRHASAGTLVGHVVADRESRTSAGCHSFRTAPNRYTTSYHYTGQERPLLVMTYMDPVDGLPVWTLREIAFSNDGDLPYYNLKMTAKDGLFETTLLPADPKSMIE